MKKRLLNNPLKKLLFITLIAISNTISAQVFVNLTATGMNNGTSWTDAYTNLKTAINNTSSGEIWVAMGTYKPTTSTSQSLYFSMKNGVEIYGGFVGNETIKSQRDYLNNVTILSGDIGIVNDSTDNSYHVIYNSNLNNTAILDGFTIQNGNANGNNGAGIYNSSSNPTIQNCTIKNNTDLFSDGGGIYNSSSSPYITNCIFINNKALNGGGICNKNSGTANLLNCQFISNKASNDGGGYYTDGTWSPNINKCTFTSNISSNRGGGCFFSSIYPNLDSLTFTSNSANISGGAIYIQSGSMNLSNSTFTSNFTFGNNGFIEGGGAILNLNGSSNISNCIFKLNTALTQGGAFVNYNLGNSTITNCVFESNSSTSGGGIFNYNSTPNIINSIFISNSSAFGGGIQNYSSSTNILNCTFSKNTSTNDGGGIINYFGSPNIKNCILWDNLGNGNQNISNVSSTPNISYSIIQGGYAGNLNSNPIFYNPLNPIGADGIWRTLDDGMQITSLSPAINSSDPTTTLPITDITNSTRIGIFDIGAYESNNSFPLALNDIELTGINYINFNKLKWNGNEKYIQYEIQKLNETKFETIGNIENSNLETYHFEDDLINQNTNTYRLLAKDITGNFFYSNSITLINNKDFSHIRIAPNPTNKNLTFLIDSKNRKNINVNIYNSLGKVIIYKSFPLTAGMNEITIDVENLVDGYYSLEIITNSNNRNVETFIKKSN